MQERWDESEMIIRGAMVTCEHQHAVCSENDTLALGSALSELHVLKRQWPGALDAGVDVNVVLNNSFELKTASNALNVSRLSAASEAAMVRHALLPVYYFTPLHE